MTDQSRDIKKSKFTGQSTVEDSATFDFVINDTNRKITKEDLVAEFGTTGTLQQEGDVGGTPILNKSGSINNIRNLEDGPGVKASVSPQGGATIESSFIQDTDGEPILINPTNITPTIASILQGSGISISKVGTAIQISTTDIPIGIKTVIVNALSDLPAAVGGVITLADNTDYLLGNDITTSSRFVTGNDCDVRGVDSTVILLTYTGVDTMFTVEDKTFKLTTISIDCPNGTLFDVSGTGAEVFQMLNMTVESCDIIGSIDSVAALQITDVFFGDIKTNGLLFKGDIPIVVFDRDVFFINGGTLVDFGTATFDGLTGVNSFMFGVPGIVGISGLPNSGNINVGGLGTLINARISGTGGTPLVGITPQDARWQFALNDKIEDTRSSALMSHNGPTTITIAGANTPVLIAPNWVEEGVSQFATDANGRITLETPKRTTVPITYSMTAEAISGTNKSISFYVYKNGIQIANSISTNKVSAGDPKNTTVIWEELLSPADYIEIWIENNTDAVDLIVNTGIARMN